MRRDITSTVMENNSRKAYRAPTSTDTAEYQIRAERNHLQEDPDAEEDIVYRVIPGSKVKNGQLKICAEHFSSHYGVWSEIAQETMGTWAKPGQHIRMSRGRLRAQCLPDGANNMLVLATTKRGQQIGHCFVSQWKHDNDRVWWVTQLLVLEGYRNQKRATRMLQALRMHYDIGKADEKDYVGVASSQPYTICAVLRVFGRGIEALPSKPDWEKNPGDYPHTPLPKSICASIMNAAPVNYICGATLLSEPNSLIADTNFFVDHGAPDEALVRVIHSMNKLVPEPWEWLFGDLKQGCEYLCILDYRHDPMYKLEKRFHSSSPLANEVQLTASVNGTGPSKAPSSTSQGSSSSKSPGHSSSAIDYADLDRYLLEVPSSCCPDPQFGNNTPTSLMGSKRKRIFEAKRLVSKQMFMLHVVMGAKPLPENLRLAYSNKDLPFPLPESVDTWKDFTEYVTEALPLDLYAKARMLILMAIHFQELLDEHEKKKKEQKKKRLEEEKTKKRMEEKRLWKKVEEMKMHGPPTINGANTVPTPTTHMPASDMPASKLHVKFGPTQMPSRTPQSFKPPTTAAAPAPEKQRTTSKLGLLIPFRRSSSKRNAGAIPIATVRQAGRTMTKPLEAASKAQDMSTLDPVQPTTPQGEKPHILEPTPPPTLPRQTAKDSAGPAPFLPLPSKTAQLSRNGILPEMTPPSTPNPPPSQSQTPTLSTSQPSRIPRYTPHSKNPSTTSANSAQRNQASEQRYKTSSPHLFFSDNESDEDRLRIPVLRFPRNSGDVLQKGRVGRGNGVRDVR